MAEQPGNQILIVDDVPENLQVLGSMLQRKGYEINVASSGMDALSLVEKNQPDLILLDVAMPQMDGFQVCEALKQNDVTKNIPVVFLTAHSDKERIVRGFQVGGVDYITKPFHAAELLARVHTHLELKFSREELLRRNTALQHLNDEKNELMGIVAHDLKNPLNGIRGIAEILIKDESLPRDQSVEFFTSIFDSAEKMFALIKNLLSINAIERGAITLQIQPVALAGIVEHIVTMYQQRASNKNIIISLDNQPAVVEADETAIVQILDNLISNAVKYSPFDKKIYISVNSTSDEEQPVVQIRVRDEGPGLTEDDKNRLFGKFARLSAKPTGGEHSTGLGLSIVKKMVEAMKGKVWCESAAGNGATFIVQLPRSAESL